MKKTCKTATALTLSLTITAVNTANFLQGKNVLNAKATTIVNTANEEPIIDHHHLRKRINPILTLKHILFT